MNTKKTSTPLLVKVSNLRFNQRVKNKFSEGDYLNVKERIKQVGFSTPLVVERITNKVLSGNLLLLIALELGISNIPVVYLDLNS
jgi:hypothetical protein